MTPPPTAWAGNARAAWTCPWCPLACDDLGHPPAADALAACPRAAAGLAGWQAVVADAAAGRLPQPLVDGQPATLQAALDAAAQRLAAARQPLLAGMGCDVAGARALYPLACRLGAVVDAAGGEAPWHGLRALQDRGQFTTTLAEVRTRADVLVFIGGLPQAVAPRFIQRLGLDDPQVPQRRVVVLGRQPGDDAALAALQALPGVQLDLPALPGDVVDHAAGLAAALAAPWLTTLPAPLQALAAQLKAARYAVLVGAPALLPAQGALVVEAVHRAVGTLNAKSRAAALWLGGGNGVAAVQQVWTWLSGLPTRTRIGPRGLDHQPQLLATQALLDDQAVDALLWVSAFEAGASPPPEAHAFGIPTVVLGHPGMAAACAREGMVFIPVATPGATTGGHLFRTDGTVLVPLVPLPGLGAPPLPGVAELAAALLAALPPSQQEQAA